MQMTETGKYVDDEHKSIFLKLLNEQRLEGEHCDIAVVVAVSNVALLGCWCTVAKVLMPLDKYKS